MRYSTGRPAWERVGVSGILFIFREKQTKLSFLNKNPYFLWRKCSNKVKFTQKKSFAYFFVLRNGHFLIFSLFLKCPIFYLSTQVLQPIRNGLETLHQFAQIVHVFLQTSNNLEKNQQYRFFK